MPVKCSVYKQQYTYVSSTTTIYGRDRLTTTTTSPLPPACCTRRDSVKVAETIPRRRGMTRRVTLRGRYPPPRSFVLLLSPLLTVTGTYINAIHSRPSDEITENNTLQQCRQEVCCFHYTVARTNEKNNKSNLEFNGETTLMDDSSCVRLSIITVWIIFT